jgi:hypothetical protein
LDKIVGCLGIVGRAMPNFQRYTSLFDQNTEIKKIMGMYYGLILDLHVTVLNFFGGSSEFPTSFTKDQVANKGCLEAWKLFLRPADEKQQAKLHLSKARLSR